MRVLVTGNLGYIGAVLVPRLLAKGCEVIGFDTGFYKDGALAPIPKPTLQIKKDIRDAEAEDLRGVEAVIHLAALSNDPVGELDPSLTDEINRDATVRLAELARGAGATRFVFACSQSMYGVADISREVMEDDGEKRPETAYGRTKLESENALKAMGNERFAVTSLRLSTVFGKSPALRTDIVFNNFLATAFTTGRIEVKSDGSPWRPVLHVEDAAEAFLAALEAPTSEVSGESINIGFKNYTVRELVSEATKLIPGGTTVFTGEAAHDKRTYRVSFEKMRRIFGTRFNPVWTLERGGKELLNFFREVSFTEKDLRGSRCTRLRRLRELQSSGALDAKLRWISSSKNL